MTAVIFRPFQWKYSWHMKNVTENPPQVFQLRPGSPHTSGKDIEVLQILDDERRRVIGLSLRGGSVLKRHHADEPITVQCVSGTCQFRSGKELDQITEMTSGTLLALDAGIEHEVQAGSDTQLIVSKFK
jgi:quercetin dioxygenase-like cupin family protein